MGPENEDDERYCLIPRPERVLLIIQPFARLTLAELLPKLSPELKLIVFYQILEGVGALHNANLFPLVHRDLKPANIGVVAYEAQHKHIAIVILDYGQTIQLQPQRPVRGKAGTPGYQAPEMQSELHDISLDIWSCGIIGLRLLVPNWPHASNEIKKTDFEIGVAELAAGDQALAQHLIAQMLAWDPKKRISASDALFHLCFASIAKESHSTTLKRSR
ncbi:putative serine/threonine-protein kinase HSL1 [Lachnellula suecica]|uniref:Putative serine/threonine-protein kinase HSL1 n=1 Tax=Lachnellula suecica TaxID=602035 RepID=A0A8T9C920_9HELO|nr:putative serine/threonine-protein kinase HSL1 [Lachnellula suecica]